MPIKKEKQFTLIWIEDGEKNKQTAKGFADLFRKLEAIHWKVLNSVDISELKIIEQ